MPTQITAVLDRATLEQLLRELTPLHVRPDVKQDRFFIIDQPSLIEFLPGRGVRIRTSARAQWTVAGLPIPLTIASATFVLEPAIAPAPEKGLLKFKLLLEEIDLKNVPSIVESSLIPLINEALAVLDHPLGWDFAKTLSVRLPISSQATPLEAFTLGAGAASCEVTGEAIVLKLALLMHFEKAGAPLNDAAPPAPGAAPAAAGASTPASSSS